MTYVKTMYMNITLTVISIYIRMKLIVALYRGVQFFSHVRMDPTLPGFNQYCRELMCLAQGHNQRWGNGNV